MMVLKNYSLKNLYICPIYTKVTSHNYKFNDHFLILQKEEDYRFDNYKCVFTNSKYKKDPHENYSIGDIVILKVIPIDCLCTDKELLRGKISKKRLLQIYNELNHKNEINEFQSFEDEEIKKLMLKYDIKK